jgi:hypothetical protein
VDLPSLALTLAGWAVLMGTRRRGGVVVAALLMVAAGYTRQTAVLAPLAATIALAWSRDWRRLGWFLIPYAGVGLAALAIAQLATGGEFWRHTVSYNVNVFDWAGWRAVMRNEVWFFYRWWLALLIVCAIGQMTIRGDGATGDAPAEEAWRRRATWVYALLATFSLLGYAKIGAAPNYMLEPLAAWALWTGERVAWLLRRREPVRTPARAGESVLGVAVVVLVAVHAEFYAPSPVIGSILRQPSAAPFFPLKDAPLDQPPLLVGLARQAKGDVFCEQPIVAMLAGKPVVWQPFITSRLAREGRWDARPLIEKIESGGFGCLIVHADFAAGGDATEYERYTAAMGAAIRRHYRPAIGGWLPAMGQYWVWYPAGDRNTESTLPVESVPPAPPQ